MNKSTKARTFPLKMSMNVGRQIKAAYGRTSSPGKPMKTVLKGRMLTRKKP